MSSEDFCASPKAVAGARLKSSAGSGWSRAARFRLEWDTGVILPVSVRHLSPGLAPQAGHSKSIAFIVTVYPDSRQHNLFHLIWYVRIGLISGGYREIGDALAFNEVLDDRARHQLYRPNRVTWGGGGAEFILAQGRVAPPKLLLLGWGFCYGDGVYFSDAISITKRYFTSLRNMRS